MAERFIRLYELQNNLYAVGSPVIVSAGALLKDSQTNNVIVQLKFHSISATSIKALKVGIAAFDVAGKEIAGVDEYQYLDLNIHNGQEFGSNKAIMMPDVVIRSFSIKSLTVVLADGSVLSVSLPMSALPQAETLQSALKNPELVKQYKLATNKHATYIPQEFHGLWECSCGEWNRDNSCIRCREQKITIFSSYDLSSLTSEMDIRLNEEKRQREAQEKVKQEEARRLAIKAKRRRAILTIILSVTVFALAFEFWFYPNVIKPSIAYKQAQELLSNEQYTDALNIFNQLGTYKESVQLGKLCSEQLALQETYERAISQYEHSHFALAYETFAMLGEYKDSADYAEQCKQRIGAFDRPDVLSLFPMVDYGISLQSICGILGSESYEGRSNGWGYRSYYFSDNYVLNGISSKISFKFKCESNDTLAIENDGALISMTWWCPDELADFQMYQNLKKYITSVMGMPTKESTAENSYGETYAYYTYWDDMQLSYYWGDVYFKRSIPEEN